MSYRVSGSEKVKRNKKKYNEKKSAVGGRAGQQGKAMKGRGLIDLSRARRAAVPPKRAPLLDPVNVRCSLWTGRPAGRCGASRRVAPIARDATCAAISTPRFRGGAVDHESNARERQCRSNVSPEMGPFVRKESFVIVRWKTVNYRQKNTFPGPGNEKVDKLSRT